MYEEAVTYALLLAIGASTVVVAIVEGMSFGAGLTMCALMAVGGVAGMVRLARRPRLPRARIGRSS